MAIQALTDQMQGKTSAIEGDIKGAYDNVDHDILFNLIKKDIQEKKLLNLNFTRYPYQTITSRNQTNQFRTP